MCKAKPDSAVFLFHCDFDRSQPNGLMSIYKDVCSAVEVGMRGLQANSDNDNKLKN
jgi:hypothetical protein